MGRLEKMLSFISVSGKKLLFTFAKKILPLKGKKFWGFILEVRTIGPITIDLKGQKKNAFTSFVMVCTPLALSQYLFL